MTESSNLVPQGWERLYLDALLRNNYERLREYESVGFFANVIAQEHSVVQELLLHRTISRLITVDEAAALASFIEGSWLEMYGPRILARIADEETVQGTHTEFNSIVKMMHERPNYTASAIRDWKILSDDSTWSSRDTPEWTKNLIPISSIMEFRSLEKIGISEVFSLLTYLRNKRIRLYHLAIMTFLSSEEIWAGILHGLLAVPYFEIGTKSPAVPDKFVHISPGNQWVPHWQITVSSQKQLGWEVYEIHTEQILSSPERLAFYKQITVLLALSCFLRDGINLAPIDSGTLLPPRSSFPFWGFRRQDYAAVGTGYLGSDIQGLAMSFLEVLPPEKRTSEFRSRLAIHLASKAWKRRGTCSALTAENGFYRKFLRLAVIYNENRFQDVIEYVGNSNYALEPAFQYLASESAAAIELCRRLESASVHNPGNTSDQIICVTHASLPEQTGGYALRAHGILRALDNQGFTISAVTRPGYPDSTFTSEYTVEVDGISYRRLPSTGVSRQRGEIQHMLSFVEPFKRLFQELGNPTVHVRSTFLIALPALVAARELGLKILYEVSGLWELVYRDREDSSQVLSRSSFAELAETITMTHVDQLVVMNESVYQIAISRGVPKERLHIAPNAVDVTAFKPLGQTMNKTFTIGYVGSFQDYEGLDDLIGAVKCLRAQGILIRALIVGDGLKFKSIRSRIQREGLEESIELTGRVPHEAVTDYYRKMDVLVYPRRSTGATETITPLKPFEALALAKPIIVSDVAPLREIVGNNERGLIFQNANVEDLCHAITRLMNDESLQHELGAAGLAWVVANRSWDNVVSSFVEAYKQLH